MAETVARRVLSAAQHRVATFLTHRATTALPGWLEQERQSRQQDRSIALAAAERTIQGREERLRTVRARLEQNHPAQKLAGQFAQLSRLRERLAGLPLLRDQEERLEATRRRVFAEPLHRLLESERAALADRRTRQRASLERCLERRSFIAERIGQNLDALDPRIVLRRGYSLALDSGGRALVSSKNVRVGDRLRLLLGDGELGAAVESVRPPRELSGTGPAAPRSAGQNPEGNPS